ncbi:hypothetical protein [Merismopedia glauca]|uniref:Uncharacterized protein n=1 Tax=Merismopedia glauca CCAP 1448/3 TaxID=1296344 RepID=A0A2T1C370_9CYAN|nr:hypothetical protein [Merismopedia glauca]PSB02716.1 hypothetical protein C7B64_11840 [Merismopedia glauca CCAP 1448/3]
MLIAVVITADRETSNGTNSVVTNQSQRFVQSLTDTLSELTAVEVNTMVVDDITPNKFIPWEVYRDIYPISKQYLDRQGIHKSLRQQYLHLRKQLEIEYCLYLKENDPTILQDSRILTDPTVSIEQIETRLPNPLNPGISSQEVNKINELLHNGRLLRTLRKIGELKVSLDRQNQMLNSSDNAPTLDSNIIYVQTITQIDGEITNRFHQQFLNHQHKDLIFQLHQEAVTMGDRQWQGLVEFTVKLLQFLS